MADNNKQSKWSDFFFYALPVVSPGLTVLCTTQIGGKEGAGKILLIVSAVVSAMLAPLFSLVAQRRYRQVEGIKFEAAMSAVIDHMGTLTSGPDDSLAILRQIHDRLITTLAKDVSSRARAAFYSLDEEGRLKREVVYGGANPPERFDEKDEQALLNAIMQGEPVYIDDNRDTKGNLKINLGDDYQSALVAPAYAGSVAQGVLIIDAPKAKELSKVRKSYVLVFAHMIGTATALGRRAAVE
ncbi:GAF domain-containing protein [Streptomyces cinnamoneus]|uniref:GAF domain-containing protein n=1 Tax=Streptomyces cinnamoneus TaxID=53446 RepID=UPI003444777F